MRLGYPMPHLIPMGGIPPVESPMAQSHLNRYPYIQGQMLAPQIPGIPPQTQQMQPIAPRMCPSVPIPPLQFAAPSPSMYLQPPGPPPSLSQPSLFPPAPQPQSGPK